jgi:hypothetical protein
MSFFPLWKHPTNDQNFLKSNDDDFVKAMLGSEKVRRTQTLRYQPLESNMNLISLWQVRIHCIPLMDLNLSDWTNIRATRKFSLK